MYPDVIDVQALLPDRLSVRFADGTTGMVEIAQSHLTGVFAPLRDPETFAQVCVVDGFVSWPGEIDLAPDAMYAAIVEHGVWRLD